MASLKVTIFFRDANAAGWSESFYYNGLTDPTSITTAVQALVNVRAGILTNTATMTHARVNSGNPRQPFIVPLGGGTGVPGSEVPPSSPADVALLTRLEGGTLVFNRPFIRGFPQRVVAAETYTPDAAFSSAMAAFLGQLIGNVWNAVGSTGGSPTPLPIATMVPTPPRGFILTFSAAQSFAIGQKLRIHATRIPGYGGIKVVTATISPTAYQMGGAAPPVAETGSSPFATVPGLTDTQITSAFVEGVSNRKSGRPFGQQRGRGKTLYSLRR